LSIINFIPLNFNLKLDSMKKILAIAFMVMFVGAMAMPVLAENPPKEKPKTEAKSTDSKKTGSKTQDKKEGKKCTGACCADKEKTAPAK
jgi:hypothetical protein